jgi:hypothetical protein
VDASFTYRNVGKLSASQQPTTVFAAPPRPNSCRSLNRRSPWTRSPHPKPSAAIAADFWVPPPSDLSVPSSPCPVVLRQLPGAPTPRPSILGKADPSARPSRSTPESSTWAMFGNGAGAWRFGPSPARLALRHSRLHRGRAASRLGGLHCDRPASTWFRDDGIPLSRHTPQRAAIGDRADIIALMDALKIGRAIVTGFDWGAWTANIMAVLWPERSKAMVSVSGYLRRPPRGDSRQPECRSCRPLVTELPQLPNELVR